MMMKIKWSLNRERKMEEDGESGREMLSRKSNLAPSLAQPKEGRRQGEETQREGPWTDHNILHKVHSTNFTLLLNQVTKRAS